MLPNKPYLCVSLSFHCRHHFVLPGQFSVFLSTSLRPNESSYAGSEMVTVRTVLGTQQRSQARTFYLYKAAVQIQLSALSKLPSSKTEP